MRRQGGVLIQEVAAIPRSARRHKTTVLASGDITGHRPRIEDHRTVRIFSRRVGPGAELFLEVTAEKARVVHPEHETIVLPRGRYRVWRQREFEGSGARVVDD